MQQLTDRREAAWYLDAEPVPVFHARPPVILLTPYAIRWLALVPAVAAT